MLKKLKNKHSLVLVSLILFVYTIMHFIFSYNFKTSSSKSTKNVMFVMTTKEVHGKSVTELAKAMIQTGHNVKFSFVPLRVHNGTTIDIDSDFVKEFPPEDVFFPCGIKGKYTECTDISFEDIDNYRPDYIFVQNPYNAKQNLSLKKLTKKLAYVVYGPHVFHQSFINDENLPNIMDVVFVDSESSAKIYHEGYKFHKENIIVSGYQSYKDIRDLIKSTSKNTKETILWLPRWVLSFRDRDKFEGGSTFLNYHYFFYNYALANPDINFIIRPHTHLFSFAVTDKHMSQNDLDAIVNRFTSLPNVTVSYHAYQPLWKDVVESDIVISDGTSALGEVVVADKPIIYLSNGWNNEFNGSDLSRQLKNYVHLAYDPNGIMHYIDLFRKNGYQPLSDKLERNKFIKLVDPVEDPAKFIAEYILNE